MFWLPNRSTWVAPIITWRRPLQTTSNMRRYGFQVSITRASASGDGLVVGDERRLAVGHHQVGLEAGPGQPTADHRDGADRVGEAARRRPGSTRRPRPRTRRPGSPARTGASVIGRPPSRTIGQRGLVGGLVGQRQPLGPERRPTPSGPWRWRVLLLERLVPRVVGIARGGVGAVGRLDHAVDEQPADPQPGHVAGLVDAGPRWARSARRTRRTASAASSMQVVEVEVRSEEGGVAALVADVEVARARRRGGAPARRPAPRRRRRRDGVGRADRAQLGVRPGTGPTRARPGVGRNGTRHAAAWSPRRNMPSSSSVHCDRHRLWRALRKCGSRRGSMSSETNANVSRLTLPAAQSMPTSGPP